MNFHVYGESNTSAPGSASNSYQHVYVVAYWYM